MTTQYLLQVIFRKQGNNIIYTSMIFTCDSIFCFHAFLLFIFIHKKLWFKAFKFCDL